MILSQADLRRSVKAGEIAFNPGIEEKQWGEASIDLRLGFQFTKLKAVSSLSAISIAEGLQSVGGMGIWNTIHLKEKDSHGKIE